MYIGIQKTKLQFSFLFNATKIAILHKNILFYTIIGRTSLLFSFFISDNSTKLFYASFHLQAEKQPIVCVFSGKVIFLLEERHIRTIFS